MELLIKKKECTRNRKECYDKITAENVAIPISQKFHNNPVRDLELDWKSIYILPHIVSVETKVRFSIQVNKDCFILEPNVFQNLIYQFFAMLLLQSHRQNPNTFFCKCPRNSSLWNQLR